MAKFTARPTTYKGVEMRSRLEAGFAHWLDHWNFDWEYEPRAFAGKHGQYLPDFRLDGVMCSWRDDPATVYVETKPANYKVVDHPGIHRQMATIWESEPSAEIIIIKPDVPSQWASVGYLTAGPPIWQEAEELQFTFALWTLLPGRRLGLTVALPAAGAPWPDEYWKVKG